MKPVVLLLTGLLCMAACQNRPEEQEKPDRAVLEKHLDNNVQVYGSYAVVKLPIRTGARIWNPVQIVRGPEDVMYAANHTGEIYSLLDTDGDGLEDHAELFCDVRKDGLRAPASMIFKGQDLYVGTAQEVRIYTDQDGDRKADVSRTFLGNLPHSEHPYEWTSGLTFGPDEHLYLVLTTDSWNAGASPDPEGWRGALLRISPDGKKVERYATGLRSVPAMIFHEAGDLLFLDNQGGGNPGEELNIAVKGRFYGHNPAKYDDPPVTEPLYVLRTEVAPAGMAFNPAGNDFDGTTGDLFVAFYGPGERWERGAIGRLRLQRQPDGHFQVEEFPVASRIPKISDLEFGANGDLYVAHVGKTDYWYQSVEEVEGAFYRLVDAPWVQPTPIDTTSLESMMVSEGALAQGQQLFAERACSACHAVDGKTELLGPNLKDIGHIYTREELLEEIKEPSKRIKPSMTATRITYKNGEVLLGRVVGADQDKVRLMIIGNRIVDIPRGEVQTEEPVMESLMYEKLLEGMSEEDINALLSYLVSLQQANERL